MGPMGQMGLSRQSSRLKDKTTAGAPSRVRPIDPFPEREGFPPLFGCAFHFRNLRFGEAEVGRSHDFLDLFRATGADDGAGHNRVA